MQPSGGDGWTDGWWGVRGEENRATISACIHNGGRDGGRGQPHTHTHTRTHTWKCVNATCELCIDTHQYDKTARLLGKLTAAILSRRKIGRVACSQNARGGWRPW
mmetsp:Transcript_26917/g.67039  ORF Transcript_26917/g.67039 Transcript_26917/m.67039 type:complete len:105 (+) Transcript_26917:741-1055(+)